MSGAFGVTSMTARLERVLVRRPTTTGDFAGAGWRHPDGAGLLRQHERFCELLAGLGCDVVVADAVDGLVDAVYMYDSAFVSGRGALILRSAKPAREAEAGHAETSLVAAGVPVAGRLEGPARADGGDLLYLDDRTLVAGRGYRTNAEAHRQLVDYFAGEGIAVERVDLPHDQGPAHVLHTMSFISPVTPDLCVTFPPLMPVPLVELLAERGIRQVPVPEAEYLSMGCNVLAVAPGVVVLLAGNVQTARALAAHGCDVHEYDGSELSLKGDGGPTCLTRPLLRR